MNVLRSGLGLVVIMLVAGLSSAQSPEDGTSASAPSSSQPSTSPPSASPPSASPPAATSPSAAPPPANTQAGADSENDLERPPENDEFIPSEEIPADVEVTFPVDI